MLNIGSNSFASFDKAWNENVRFSKMFKMASNLLNITSFKYKKNIKSQKLRTHFSLVSKSYLRSTSLYVENGNAMDHTSFLISGNNYVTLILHKITSQKIISSAIIKTVIRFNQANFCFRSNLLINQLRSIKPVPTKNSWKSSLYDWTCVILIIR